MDGFITLVGLTFAAFGYPVLVVALERTELLPHRYTLVRSRVGGGLEWVVAAALIAYVAIVEGRPLGSIGLRIRSDEIVSGVVLGLLVVLVAAAVTTSVLERAGEPIIDEVSVLLLAQPLHWKVILALTAGFTEEIIFRGYLVERTLELTGSALAAGALSVGAFTLAHAPRRQPLRSLAPIAGIGVGFVVAYLLVRNAVVLGIVHAAVDATIWATTDPEEVLERTDASRLDGRVVSILRDE